MNVCAVLVLLAAPSLSLGAADPSELAGRWIGGIDTTKGQMDIGLELTLEKGKLVGTLKTAHGVWEVTSVTEKDAVWTVNFKSPGAPGKLVGRVKDGKYTGRWESEMATGTFEVTRARKKN